jgi:uncharacterized protein YutE (UPF0331/DUF86 family)
MVASTINLEREKLLQLAEEYRDKGYSVSLHPSSKELPDFLKNYRPELIAHREGESVIVEVKSRISLPTSAQSLRDLAQVVEQHPGWRFELVMTNPEEVVYETQTGNSLQKPEIEARLQVAEELTKQYPESALLYAWSVAEATLRLVTEHEGLSFQRTDSAYLIKQLATEGVISRLDYHVLTNSLSFRNAVAHGFKTPQVTPETIYELIELVKTMLNTLLSEKMD